MTSELTDPSVDNQKNLLNFAVAEQKCHHVSAGRLRKRRSGAVRHAKSDSRTSTCQASEIGQRF